jgi:alpha-mannosidase
MPHRHAYYVLSTHWDREWYQTFQNYRYQLVHLLDRVLDGLTDGRLRGPFQTDGQAILLTDYLEVRPERRPQVEQLARAGKLSIGPWYALPDEFIVSGESLIRNLSLGRQVARRLGGEPSNAGFVCDIFGHNSQLPQIFAGFGIRGGFIWRGLNTIQSRLVRWRGADGTELPCYRFGKRGYCSYAVQVRHADNPQHAFDVEQGVSDLDAYLEAEGACTEAGPILLFDGGDHMAWDEAMYEALVLRIDHPDPAFRITHADLDAYLAEMLPQAGDIVALVEGELREPGRYPADEDQQWLIPGVLSSRVWIKQANAECQAKLCHWAEPLGVFAHAALGSEYPRGFLDVAWKWLLENHPHDSICGCSIDTVHEDMKYRFSQCRQIADRLTTESTRQLAASVADELADGELRVAIFNPLPRPFDQTVELTLHTPMNWPTFNEFFGFEPKPAFRIYDAEGWEVAYQRLGQAMNRTQFRAFDSAFPQTYKTHDIQVSLPVHVPAMGYTTLTVRPGALGGRPTRHPATPALATGERSMANEHLAVTVEANGTLTLTDRRTGQTYGGLLTFEDCADIGDGWYHGVAANDRVAVSSAGRADVTLVHSGPMLTTFRVRVTLAVPAEFQFDRMARSEQSADLVIDSLVSLRPGADRVEVETTVHNTARDHRLRALFPSGAAAQTSLADSPFDVVERPIALRADNHLYRELEVETKPQQSWTAVYAGQRGLAVISAGLVEAAVRDLPDRPIALTLFRATRRTVFTDGEPNGQLPGALTFRYWIAPLTGEPDRTRLCELGQLIVAGVRDAQLGRQDMAPYAKGAGQLPPATSFLRVEGPAVVTSLRRVGEGVEVRMFNPANEPAAVTLHLSELLHVQHAQRVDFESNPLDGGEPEQVRDSRIHSGGGAFNLSLKPKQIVTIRLS